MIGNVPDGWQLKDFLKVFKDDTARKKKIPTNNYLEIGDIPVIDQGKRLISGYTNDKDASNKDQPIIIFGDHTRALKYIDFNFAIGADGVKVLKNIDQNSNTKYLYYTLHNSHIPNTGYNRHFQYVKRLDIPIPPLPQQEKIVKVLDISSALIEKQKELIKKYDLFLKAKFVEMFGDPISNPMGWEVERLGIISDKITDGTHKTPIYQTNGIKFVSAKNIKNEHLNFNDCKYISIEEHNDLIKRCNPEYKNILLTKSGSIGMSSIVPKVDFPFSLFESLCLIKFDIKKIEPFYLREFLNSDSTKYQYKNLIKGIAIKHLHLKDIRSLKIPIPPIELQNKFAQIVEKTEQIKQQEAQKLEHLQTLHDSLMSRAFKGEIQ